MAAAEAALAHRLQPGGLYDPANMPLLHHMQQGLRAHALFKLDVDYVVKDGQVVIVDEFTGRLMPGRRWSDGLHQAVEAKEKVKIERENQTLATITLQNYFRKYSKLSGMTGTADTEAEEFNKIYKLDVVVVPTNRPLTRIEEPDLVYKTEAEKFEAIVADVLEKQEAGRPVLVGTVSVEKSERLSGMLRRRGVKHVVLNAKYHAQEAEIVAQAGRLGTVTVATNMAGRGTDILLGGNAEFMARQQALGAEAAERLPKSEARFIDDDEFVYFFHIDSFYRVPRAVFDPIFETLKAQCDTEHDAVVAAGGLHIVGTERHESRRIDNQLRGRAGRQGDPGSSRFYLSLEDDLMRIFGTANIRGLMERLGMEDGVPIEHKMVTKAIARAQRQVEAQNFSMRKHLLEYDDVMNKQRENVYTLRRQLLESKIKLEDEPDPVDTQGYLLTVAEDVVANTVDEYCPPNGDHEDWDVAGLKDRVEDVFGLDGSLLEEVDEPGLRNEAIADTVWTSVTERLPRERGDGRQGAVPRPGRRPAAARARGAPRRDHDGAERAAARARRPRHPGADFAQHHAADRRPAVEGSPLQPRPPEGRHRPARLRPARSAGRVQEGELHALPGDEGPHRRGDGPLPVAAPPRHRDRRRRRPGGPGRAEAPAGPEAVAADVQRHQAGASAAVGGVRRDRCGAALRRQARLARRASAATTRRSSRSGVTSPRSAATIPARAAAARSTRSATGPTSDAGARHPSRSLEGRRRMSAFAAFRLRRGGFGVTSMHHVHTC